MSEILLGALFVLAYLRLGVSIGLLLFLFALTLLLTLVLYDIAHQILPSLLLGLFILTSALAGYALSSSVDSYANDVIAAVLAALFLFLIYYASKGRAIGFADAPLAFGLALLVGPQVLSGFLYSFWIGATIGIIILLRRPLGARMGVEVPFAPYLAAGFLLAYFTQWNIFTIIGGFTQH